MSLALQSNKRMVSEYLGHISTNCNVIESPPPSLVICMSPALPSSKRMVGE